MSNLDFLVVGAGILGLAAAAELSGTGKVLLLEQEEHPCHHSSGRSAAIFVRSYGSPQVQALTEIAGKAFEDAESGGRYSALSAPCGLLTVIPAGSKVPGAGLFQASVTASEAARLNPILSPERIEGGWWEASAQAIDVHAMQMGLLAVLRANGGRLLTCARVVSASRSHDLWEVKAGSTSIRARTVINAAGAWADQVGEIFGATPLGLVAKRRSAAIIDAPPGIDPTRLPMVVDVGETVYFKPDAGRLMLSPADETPVEPHDAWAENMDIAIAVDRYENLTGRKVTRVGTTWAGLRTFLPDGNPAIGPDTNLPDLYWLAGFGGFGVQTAPAAAILLASIIRGSVRNTETQFQDILQSISPFRRQ